MTSSDKIDVPLIETPISYLEFVKSFLLPAKPCIFGEWLTRSWKSRQDFVLPNGNGVNLEQLNEKYGSCSVLVSNCEMPSYGYGGDSAETVLLRNFINTWHSNGLKYVKDFHFQRDVPTYKPYDIPVYFQSDWLNEFWDYLSGNIVDDASKRDDFRFMYAGPAGTWTPLHCDVIRSHSWSANIAGTKRWLLFEPQEADKLDQFVKDKQEPNMDRLASLAESVDARFADIYQQPGQVIFVPSQWGHQVRNETDVISLNHNWLNAFNVMTSFLYLKENWEKTEKELAEFGVDIHDGLEENIEKIVNLSAGCGMGNFVRLIENIASNRLNRINSIGGAFNKSCPIPTVEQILQHYCQGNLVPDDFWHCVVDLGSIKLLIENEILKFKPLGKLDEGKYNNIAVQILNTINLYFQ